MSQAAMNRVAADRGGATILASFAMVGLLGIAILLLHFGSVVAVRHRAQSAADLAALAAAGTLDRGVESACAAAETIAHRMSVTVQSCRVDGWDAIVTVTARVLLSTFGVKETSAIARAGPIDSG